MMPLAFQVIVMSPLFGVTGRPVTLFIIVAGDIRENVKATLAEVLDRIKAEAVTKREVFA